MLPTPLTRLVKTEFQYLKILQLCAVNGRRRRRESMGKVCSDASKSQDLRGHLEI
jgi:hypothetical protein